MSCTTGWAGGMHASMESRPALKSTMCALLQYIRSNSRHLAVYIGCKASLALMLGVVGQQQHQA